MNDDYLWDRSGEPDPEVQQLEQVLGTLRYQPRPLEIPNQLLVPRKRSRFYGLAIAASIALMILAAGMWTALHRKPATNLVAAPTNSVPDKANPLVASSPEVDKGSAPASNGSAKIEDHKPQTTDRLARRLRSGGNNLTLARNRSRDRRPSVTIPLTAGEQREAELAKQQLFLALRVASSKLALAQKRAQGTYPTNQIRNQHKVG